MAQRLRQGVVEATPPAELMMKSTATIVAALRLFEEKKRGGDMEQQAHCLSIMIGAAELLSDMVERHPAQFREELVRERRSVRELVERRR